DRKEDEDGHSQQHRQGVDDSLKDVAQRGHGRSEVMGEARSWAKRGHGRSEAAVPALAPGAAEPSLRGYCSQTWFSHHQPTAMVSQFCTLFSWSLMWGRKFGGTLSASL